MPRFDKTGPQGNGPKTGRGLGHCDKKTSDDMPRNWKGGFGRGRQLRFRRFWNRGVE